MHMDDSDRVFRDTFREFLEREVAPDLLETAAGPVSKAEAIAYQRALGEVGRCRAPAHGLGEHVVDVGPPRRPVADVDGEE